MNFRLHLYIFFIYFFAICAVASTLRPCTECTLRWARKNLPSALLKTKKTLLIVRIFNTSLRMEFLKFWFLTKWWTIKLLESIFWVNFCLLTFKKIESVKKRKKHSIGKNFSRIDTLNPCSNQLSRFQEKLVPVWKTCEKNAFCNKFKCR